LDVRPVDVIFVKENIVELALIDHLFASAASVEMFFLGFAQLVKVSGIHNLNATSLAIASARRFRCVCSEQSSAVFAGLGRGRGYADYPCGLYADIKWLPRRLAI
jgi:hypothetical protein